jgi:hypothetical protein
VAVHHGERFRGDHPAVVHAFAYGLRDSFVVGANPTREELDQASHRVRLRALASEPPVPLPPAPGPAAIPRERQVILTRVSSDER